MLEEEKKKRVPEKKNEKSKATTSLTTRPSTQNHHNEWDQSCSHLLNLSVSVDIVLVHSLDRLDVRIVVEFLSPRHVANDDNLLCQNPLRQT